MISYLSIDVYYMLLAAKAIPRAPRRKMAVAEIFAATAAVGASTGAFAALKGLPGVDQRCLGTWRAPSRREIIGTPHFSAHGTPNRSLLACCLCPKLAQRRVLLSAPNLG